jgi:16S rRNA U516 pseudouridylate synthase RsuA-like enzyme
MGLCWRLLTAPANVREESGGQGKGLWLKVILREGKKRQIGEMGKQTGLLVLRIMCAWAARSWGI